MKSTNLYQGLAIILAAAASTAVVGCAGATDADEALDAESTVASASSPCNQADDGSNVVVEHPQGAPCDSGASQGGYGAPQGEEEAPQGDCGESQSGYGAPQGEMPVSGSYYNKSVTIQTIGNPPGGDYSAGGYDEPVDESPCGGAGGYGGYGASPCGGVGGYGVGLGGYGVGLGGVGLGGYGLGGYGLGIGRFGGWGGGWGGRGFGRGGFGRGGFGRRW